MTLRGFFIVNPAAAAGRGAVHWARFEERLRRDGWDVQRAFTTAPGDAGRLAQEAAPGHLLLVAVGGDGTVSEVADGVLRAGQGEGVLGVVPCGTGNDFAQTLGIGTLAVAQKTLADGRRRLVDVIEMRCQLEGKPARRHALLFAGVGIAGESLKRTTPLVKRLFGQRLAYPVGLLRALLTYNAPPMRVVVDGVVSEQPYLFAGVSNSELAGGGLKLAPGAQIDDGRLNVNLVEALGTCQAVAQVYRLSQGRHTTHPKVRYSTALRMSVETDMPCDIAADGDLIGQTPARFEVRPRSLAVLVP